MKPVIDLQEEVVEDAENTAEEEKAEDVANTGLEVKAVAEANTVDVVASIESVESIGANTVEVEVAVEEADSEEKKAIDPILKEQTKKSKVLRWRNQRLVSMTRDTMANIHTIQESPEKNGIHMTGRVELDAVDMPRKKDSAVEAGEMKEPFTKRKVSSHPKEKYQRKERKEKKEKLMKAATISLVERGEKEEKEEIDVRKKKKRRRKNPKKKKLE